MKTRIIASALWAMLLGAFIAAQLGCQAPTGVYDPLSPEYVAGAYQPFFYGLTHPFTAEQSAAASGGMGGGNPNDDWLEIDRTNVAVRTNAAAVCVGINRVDPAVYGGEMYLSDCELDATRFANRTIAAGIPTAVLLTEEATWSNVVAAIRAAINYLPADGSGRLFLSLSGHGGRTRDLNGDEADGFDSFLCFYDRTVIDDIIGDLLAGIDKSLLAFVVCDTCHSGTAFRDLKAYMPSPDLMHSAMMARLIWQAGCRDADYSQSTGHGGICSMAVQAQDFLFDPPYVTSNNAMDTGEAQGQIMQCNEFGPVTDADRYNSFLEEVAQ